MDAFTARRTLAGIRAVIGTGALLAPHATGKVFGIDTTANPAGPFLIRMFGARELYMASPFLMPAPGLDERELSSRAVPVDAADSVAALMAGARGGLPWPAAIAASAIAAVASWLGTVAAREA